MAPLFDGIVLNRAGKCDDVTYLTNGIIMQQRSESYTMQNYQQKWAC